VACLEARFAGSSDEADATPAPPSVEPTPPAAEPEPTLTDEAAPAAVEAPPPAPTAAAAPPSTSASAPPPAAPPPAAPPLAPTPTGAKKDDALDLGATVVPVLFRTYWKHALAVLAVIILVIWLVAAL
jgi:hypothetical protein